MGMGQGLYIGGGGQEPLLGKEVTLRQLLLAGVGEL